VNGGVIVATFFCEHCHKETKFLPIHNTLAIAGVSRSTVYYWMDRNWIHWKELPSGRRVICQESLSHQAPKQIGEPELQPRQIRPKVSDPAQSGRLTQH